MRAEGNFPFSEDEEEKNNELAFLPPVLCQLSLPRSKQEGDQFMRRSGDAWLILQSGYLDEGNGPVRQALPYGPMSRLVMAFLSTQAVRFNTKEIKVGKNPSRFIELVGINGKDGRRYSKLSEQLKALAACRMQFGRSGVTVNPASPIKSFLHWGDGKSWPGVVTLSDEYFEHLKHSAVPLDHQALLSLSGSALSMDIYTWLAARLHQIKGKKPVIVYWHNLLAQFGQEYHGKDRAKDFQKRFVPALYQAMEAYPRAKVREVTGGLLLFFSPSPIKYLCKSL